MLIGCSLLLKKNCVKARFSLKIGGKQKNAAAVKFRNGLCGFHQQKEESLVNIIKKLKIIAFFPSCSVEYLQ